jgi:uncharacterized protein (TIGR03083 family)
VSEERLAQLVAAHGAVFAGLLDATEGLDDAAWTTATGCPGWDVHDQLAHCIGVERSMLGDPPPEVDVPELPHLTGPMSRIVERDVEVRRGVPGDELRAEAREVFDRRLAALESMTADDLGEELDSPIGRHRASKVLRTRVFDLVAHEHDIRRALDRETEDVGVHIDLAFEQILRAWAVVLPGRFPAGGTLGLDVAGRGEVVLDLGSGALHREGGPAPDATLELTTGQVLSLGCGRDDAPRLDELRSSGDRELLTAFLAAPSVTP